MADIKHIGRMKATGRKVVVAYRTLPGESDSALVVPTEALSPEQHDALMTLVESNAGQNAYEFAEALARTHFSDGQIMLNQLHFSNRLAKVKTSDVEMTPNLHASIDLAQLNQIIAEQRGISVNDLALGNAVSTDPKTIATVNDLAPQPEETFEVKQPSATTEPLSDSDIARNLRSQADAMYKEAAKLRAQAEELAPSKKKTAAVKAE
jgi:hypothetical protein